MSLQFIMGNSGAGKSRYAYEKILAEAARHPEKNYLIVVPEQFTMQTQKELVSLHPAGGILFPRPDGFSYFHFSTSGLPYF